MKTNLDSLTLWTWLGSAALVLGTASCGGGQPQAESADEVQVKMAPEEKADGAHLTEFQKKRLLGHYSTQDGKSGFTLDRTGETPKARLDGDKTAETLKMQGSVRGAYELVSDSKKIWLRLDAESGDVLLFQGPNQTSGVRVVRDADADQLK